MSHIRNEIIRDHKEASIITDYLNEFQPIIPLQRRNEKFLTWFPLRNGIYFSVPFLFRWTIMHPDEYFTRDPEEGPRYTPFPWDIGRISTLFGKETAAQFIEVKNFFANNYLQTEYCYYTNSYAYEIVDPVSLINIKAEAMAWRRQDFVLLKQLQIANDRKPYIKNTTAALSDKENIFSKLPIFILKNLISEFLGLLDAANLASVNKKTAIAFSHAGKPLILSANTSSHSIFVNESKKATDSMQTPKNNSRCILL